MKEMAFSLDQFTRGFSEGTLRPNPHKRAQSKARAAKRKGDRPAFPILHERTRQQKIKGYRDSKSGYLITIEEEGFNETKKTKAKNPFPMPSYVTTSFVASGASFVG